MQDPALSEPEGDVRRPVVHAVAVGDQVAAIELVLADRRAGLLLLVGVARHEPPEPAIAHVHEPGAVDPALGHAAPEIRRAEVRARLVHRVAVRTWLGEPGPGVWHRDMAGGGMTNPAGVVVRRADAGPLAAVLDHGERLAAEGLGHLLGVLVWLGADRRDVLDTHAHVVQTR